MSNFLYTSPKGYRIDSHSYSGGSEYSDCPKKYDYSRRQGWKEKEQRASSAFGTALESAIQYYHGNKCILSDAVDEWKRLWAIQQENKELTYSAKDGDWARMYQQGIEMLKLYDAKLPELPIQNPQFQLNYKKELYPDSEYAGLKFTGYVDMQTVAPFDHPLLPAIDRPENGQRTIIIDIKTSGNKYDVDPRMSSMDPQLRSYAWVTGERTVAFLVFVKVNPTIEKGDTVSLIGWYNDDNPLGSERVVLKTEPNTVHLVTPEVWAQYEEEAKGLKGNALKAVVNDYLEKHGFHVSIDEVTKQKIQFLAALISDEDAAEQGEVLGQQAISIRNANLTNWFPKKPGVRFPNNHCTFCSYLGLCLNDKDMIEEKLVNITMPQTQNSDWLEDL